MLTFSSCLMDSSSLFFNEFKYFKNSCLCLQVLRIISKSLSLWNCYSPLSLVFDCNCSKRSYSYISSPMSCRNSCLIDKKLCWAIDYRSFWFISCSFMFFLLLESIYSGSKKSCVTLSFLVKIPWE